MKTKEAEARISEKKIWLKENLTPETLKNMRVAWYPAGSGPLGCAATVCALLELLAEEKGWDVS